MPRPEGGSCRHARGTCVLVGRDHCVTPGNARAPLAALIWFRASGPRWGPSDVARDMAPCVFKGVFVFFFLIATVTMGNDDQDG